MATPGDAGPPSGERRALPQLTGGAPAPEPPADESSGAAEPAPGHTRRRAILAGVALAGLLVVVTGGSLLDATLNQQHAARRLTLGDRPVGGLAEPELRQVVAEAADAFAATPVSIRSPKGSLDTTAQAVGLTVDRDATVLDVLAVDHTGGLIERAWRAARSWLAPQSVPLRFTVDRARLDQGVHDWATAAVVPPTEPGISLTDQRIATTPAADGSRVDVDALADRLREAAADDRSVPVTLDAPLAPVPPRFKATDAEALAARAASVTDKPLSVTTGGKTASLRPAILRSWMRAVPRGDHLELAVDETKVLTDVTAALGNVGSPAADATVKMADGADPDHPTFQVVGGQPGTKCCALDSGSRVASALLTGKRSVTLDLLPVAPARNRAWADGLGIRETVGSFRTQHPCCQNRVTNIHLMADAVRGTIIEPGKVFSLNGKVGQRTTEKGYLPDHAINDASMTEEVGGGVSQFATTLFNAAFFAGLDFDEYQSHSLYISRYPYGREATVSWTKPDLKIHNNTPYGILIWPTYDDTSLTVRLYSTRWVSGEQTGQSEEPKGPCKKVRTERTRHWVDGKTAIDAVFAVYQPEEGVRCP